jgi:hypothetical protein
MTVSLSYALLEPSFRQYAPQTCCFDSEVIKGAKEYRANYAADINKVIS